MNERNSLGVKVGQGFAYLILILVMALIIGGLGRLVLWVFGIDL